jgi:hypothetical protein
VQFTIQSNIERVVSVGGSMVVWDWQRMYNRRRSVAVSYYYCPYHTPHTVPAVLSVSSNDIEEKMNKTLSKVCTGRQQGKIESSRKK